MKRFSHVDSRLWPMFDEPDERRVNYVLGERFIPYPRADYLLAEISDIRSQDPSERPKCMLISGAPGYGKSMILKEAVRLHGGSGAPSGPTGRNTQPFFRIKLPVMNDIRPMYGRILQALNVPHSLDDRPARLHETTCAALADAQTVLLGVDEIHNLLQIGKRDDPMAALRDITNQGVALLCAGIETARNVIVSDAQLRDRFRCHQLEPWKVDDDMRGFIVTLMTRVPLRRPSELDRKEAIEELIRLSDGHLGKIVTCIREAARDAIRDRTERLDVDAIKESMLRIIGEGYEALA